MRALQSIQREREQHSQMFIQPALEIGKEDDKHEKEANSVADKVMKMSDPEEEEKVQMKAEEEGKVQCMADDEEEKVQMMKDEEEVQMMRDEPLSISRMANGSESGMLAPQNVEEGISRSKGNGQSLSADLQEELGGKMNADFSSVKVHTDENAVQMNKEVGAKAFTHGNDVYFNKGQYNPTSNQGKHLLAHELTHTIQQNGKNSVQRNMIQRKTVSTAFGQFETTKFVALPTNKGAEIILKFNPFKSRVDAKQIAMTQVIKPFTSAGKTYALDPNQKNRTTAKGYYLDEMGTTNNPIYSYTKKLGPSEKLKNTPQAQNAGNPVGPTNNYEIGYCYRVNPKDAQKTSYPAGIWDTPKGGGDIGEGMTFETTAFATEGVDKNTYYGSVKWGYKIAGTAAAPSVTLTDITVASMGTPTQDFIDAAVLWNDGKMQGTYEVIANSTGTTGTADYIFNKGTKVKQIETVTLKGGPFVKNTRCMKVEVLTVAGAPTGVIAYIKTSDVKDKGDGSANKKLPLNRTTAPMTILSEIKIPESNQIPKGTVVRRVDPAILTPYLGTKNVKLKILSGWRAGKIVEVSWLDSQKVALEGDT